MEGDLFLGGAVQIGNGGTYGSLTGNAEVDGTLTFNRSDDISYTGFLTGTGSLVKAGAGALTLTADHGFSGSANVEAGTLFVNGLLSNSAVTIDGGTLGGRGKVGTTTAASGATIAPGVNDIGTLTIDGDFHSNRGILQIETELGGDASPTDLLRVTGNTSGSTNVRVFNVGGTGAQTIEGIRIVQIDGVSDGAFSLLGDYVFQGEQAVVAGAYAYRLYQGSVSDPGDGDWYLRSALVSPDPDPDPDPGSDPDPSPDPDPDEPTAPLYQPGAPLYEAYANALLGFIDIGTLHQRVGKRSWAVEAQGGDAPSKEAWVVPGLGLWAEVRGFGGRWEPETSTTGSIYDLSSWMFKAGVDMPITQSPDGYLVGGVSLHYGTFSAGVGSSFGDGDIDGTGYGAGGTLTWYANNGFYLDGQAQVTWFDSDLESSTAGLLLANGNDGVGYALSLEAGKRIELSTVWFATPQAQLIYSAVDFDDFVDPFGASVSLGSADNSVGRLGISLDRQTEWLDGSGSTNRSHLYGIANLYYDFDGGSNVDVAGVGLESGNDALWGGLGFGGSINWDNDKYSVYGEALAKTSLENFGDSYSLKGTVGFRVTW